MSVANKKLLGKGAFSKVYDNDDGTVTIVSCCPQKECLALFCNQDSPLIPKVERIEYDIFSTYVMPKFDKIRAPKQQLNSHSYKLYALLRTCSVQGYSELFSWFSDNLTDYPNERETILDFVGDLSNFGNDELRFEISPRNIAATSKGDLVLLDCFFFTDILKKIRTGNI